MNSLSSFLDRLVYHSRVVILFLLEKEGFNKHQLTILTHCCVKHHNLYLMLIFIYRILILEVYIYYHVELLPMLQIWYVIMLIKSYS